MKKLLIATTALVMTAGMAAAEVKLSGDARMGVAYGYNEGTADNEWSFSSRARVKFTLSGTTDSGLEFGASFKAHESVGAENGNAGNVFISGAFGKITMGDVTSASEELFGDLADVGYLGDDQATAGAAAAGLSVIGTNAIPYLTLDNGETSAVLYTYSTGALSIAASMSDGTDDESSVFGSDLSIPVDQTYAIAAAYTFGNYTVGLGYEVADLTAGSKMTQTELAGIAKFGNTDVKGYYAVGDDLNPVDDAVGLSVASTFGATTVKGYVQKINWTDDTDVTWYGLGADYDLGGGAILAAGIQDDDVDGSDPVANMGVKFKF